MMPTSRPRPQTSPPACMARCAAGPPSSWPSTRPCPSGPRKQARSTIASPACTLQKTTRSGWLRSCPSRGRSQPARARPTSPPGSSRRPATSRASPSSTTTSTPRPSRCCASRCCPSYRGHTPSCRYWATSPCTSRGSWSTCCWRIPCWTWPLVGTMTTRSVRQAPSASAPACGALAPTTTSACRSWATTRIPCTSRWAHTCPPATGWTSSPRASWVSTTGPSQCLRAVRSPTPSSA